MEDLVIAVTSHMVFAFNKAGSPFIQLVHSVENFEGDPFNPTKYPPNTRVRSYSSWEIGFTV